MTTELTDDMRTKYEALGIRPDVWTCIATLTKKDAQQYVFDLAQTGVPSKVATDADDPKQFHVAILGGLIDNPAAVFVNFGHMTTTTCHSTGSQHPQESSIGD